MVDTNRLFSGQIKMKTALEHCLHNLLKSFVFLIGFSVLQACTQPDGNASDTSSEPQMKTADIILTNARVYTLNWPEPDLEGIPSSEAPYDKDGWHPDANSVAISGRDILFVGDKKDIAQFKSPTTVIIDLNGATVIPGLIDSHVHVAELGLIVGQLNLIDIKTPELVVQKAVEYSNKLGTNDWLIGQGWDEGAWANQYPNRQLLDKVFPDRPVVLKSLHGFAIWTNTKALEMIGINDRTEAPVGGEILRDEAFQPTGIFLNNATNLIKNGIPEPTAEEFEKTVLDGLNRLAQDGYVSVHQAGATSNHMDAFNNLKANGRLPIRVYPMISARDVSLARKWITKGPYTDPEGWLDVRSVKAYYDGALGSRGARLLEPYSDLPDHKGVSGDGYGFDGDLVKELLSAGFQVGIHAIGDAGNRETLDYFQEIYAQNPEIKLQRNRIEHAQVVSPSDISRIADMEIIASMEPPHAVEDKTWAEQRLGSERIKGAYAWRTLRRNKVALTFNSDLPGSDHSIFYGLHSAITRKGKDFLPENGWYANESMSAEEALRGYTNWAAYSAFREKDTGVIEAGRWADITVLNIDPLQVGEKSPGELFQGKVLMTIVDGRIVYKNPESRIE